MIKERINDMDVTSISDSIQSHPASSVYMEAGSSAQPTVTMLQRFAPDSALDILDHIDAHAKNYKATVDSYTLVPADAAPKKNTGLITAHPQSGYHSFQSPAALPGSKPGGSAGADLTLSSFIVPAGPVSERTPESTGTPIRVSIIV